MIFKGIYIIHTIWNFLNTVMCNFKDLIRSSALNNDIKFMQFSSKGFLYIKDVLNSSNVRERPQIIKFHREKYGSYLGLKGTDVNQTWSALENMSSVPLCLIFLWKPESKIN